MPQYRKKPVVITAIQWTGGNANEIQKFVENGLMFKPDGHIAIQTLEGPLHADFGDWIIRGIKNEFYPCKPDIFEATYEKVENESE
jgi:hypothetical protein